MALGVDRRMREKAKEPQTIVHRDDDGRSAERAPRGELARIIVVRFAVDVAAAVDPDEHRKSLRLPIASAQLGPDGA